MYIVDLIEVLLDTTVGVMVAAAEDPWIRNDLLRSLDLEDSAAIESELLALQQPLAAVPGMEAATASGAEVAQWLAAVNAAWSALDGLAAFGPGKAPELALALGTTGIRYVFPVAYHVASALGFVVPFKPAGPRVPLYDTLDRDALSEFLSAPRTYLEARRPSLDLTSAASIKDSLHGFVDTWRRVLSALGVVWTAGVETAGLGVPDEDLLRRMVILRIWGDSETAAAGLAVSGVPDGTGEGGLIVTPFGALEVERHVGDWDLTVTGQVSAGGFQFGGDAGFRMVDVGPAPELQLVAERLGGEVIVGSASGASVRLREASVSGRIGVTAADGLTWSLAGDVTDVRLVVAADEGDGFLRTVLGERTLEATMSLGVELDAEHGLRFRGSGGLTVPTAVHVSVGPLAISQLTAAIEATPERIGAALTCDLAVRLGPVRVVLDGVGVAVSARIGPAGSPGEPWLRHGFKGPDGASLAIDAGAVSGGGVLSRAGSVYTGALALDIHGLALAAYGVLDASGSGYSLAAVVSTQFQPIPIGFGFTLDGVGGLIGVNRRVDVDALRAAVRGPGIGDIFFPAEPVAQVARLTRDLASFFPAAAGRHVFGPAVRLGWGTPRLLRASLALLLEVPAPVRLVLLGSASAALPTEDEPIIEINVDVVGEVDFARKTVAVDASLRDSKVAGFPITGDLALRMAWGDQPSFALSVGGFHSQFRRPAGFPELRRVMIPVGSGENPRLDVTGFLALTSNTAQIGAAIDLYAAAGPLNIVGNVGFEALLQFVPFEFRADLWAGVALRRGTRVLASVHLDGTLRGPTPWYFSGEACLSLWFVDLCVGFDATFGQARSVELPPREIWPQLRAALEDPRSWSTATARGVTIAAPVGESAAAARIDPASALAVRQKVVPLDRTIERFAQVAPSGLDHFDVSSAKLGEHVFTSPPRIHDWFAAAQFEALTEDERLSRPGFERMVSGVTLASDAVTTGAQLIKRLEYETIKFPDPEPLPSVYVPTMELQLAGIATRRHAPLPAPTPLVTLEEEPYVIASTDDLAPRLDITGAVGRGAAERALTAYLATHPSARGALQVVPRFEVV